MARVKHLYSKDSDHPLGLIWREYADSYSPCCPKKLSDLGDMLWHDDVDYRDCIAKTGPSVTTLAHLRMSTIPVDSAHG
jgi:hypothetical protein